MPQQKEAEQPTATRPVCPVCGGLEAHTRFGRCRDLLYATPGEFNVMACASCGLLFCHPQITREQFSTYYLASYYPAARQIMARCNSKRLANRVRQWALRLFWGPVERETAMRRVARRVLSAFSNQLRMTPPAHGRRHLLEVGCSSGEKLFLLRRHGWEAEGIEPSTDACTEAAKLGLPVQASSLEDADLRGKTYDVIELCHVFEHLQDPTGSLTKLREALAPEGKILLTLPNARSLGRGVFGRCWRGLEVPRHCAAYTSGTMRALCSRLGLRVRRVRSMVAPEVIVGSVKFALNEKLGPRKRPGAQAHPACGSRCRPEKKLKALAGRLLRICLSIVLLPPAILGFGEVMQVEIVRVQPPSQDG